MFLLVWWWVHTMHVTMCCFVDRKAKGKPVALQSMKFLLFLERHLSTTPFRLHSFLCSSGISRYTCTWSSRARRSSSEKWRPKEQYIGGFADMLWELFDVHLKRFSKTWASQKKSVFWSGGHSKRDTIARRQGRVCRRRIAFFPGKADERSSTFT